jgi:hypothetical protein
MAGIGAGNINIRVTGISRDEGKFLLTPGISGKASLSRRRDYVLT